MRLKLLGKTVFTTYNHYYYKLDFDTIKPVKQKRLNCFDISTENEEKIPLSGALKEMLKNQPGYVQGYGFRDINNQIVGHIFLMRKGGREVLYKIQNIDAYVFAVRVFEEYRGNAYAGEMITWLVDKLRGEGINALYLTVKKDNTSAIKAYERLGFKRIGSKFFVRIWKFNIPYITL